MQQHRRPRSSLKHLLGPSGMLTFLGMIAIIALITVLFAAIRPPTVDEVERDIWVDWARLTTDATGLTIVDLLLDERRAAGQNLVESVGRLIHNDGARFVLQTNVRYIRIRDKKGAVFAEWISPAATGLDGAAEPATGTGWKNLAIDLSDPVDGKVGVLEVGYEFYGSGLESLPNIRRLAVIHRSAVWLVVILAIFVFAAAMANLSRLRERSGRLQNQQVILDLARQMCHELRNGLWAFSLEGRNVRQLFQRVEEYYHYEPIAFEESAKKVGMENSTRDRMRRTFEKLLTENNVDPATDILPVSEMAQDAHQQIESFSRYINLTVEELDRHLLGADSQWEPAPIRVRDSWTEACNLLAMRFRSNGVTRRDKFETENDWVVGDKRALVHVFVNLVKNAMEAMRELDGPRELLWTVSANETTVRCDVTNFGSAIAPTDLPRIFEKGFSTKAGLGRGRGLALVHDSVRRMAGQVLVSSDRQQGTRFTIILPRADAPQPAPSDA